MTAKNMGKRLIVEWLPTGEVTPDLDRDHEPQL